MKHLKPFNQINKNSVYEAGGKGASLGEMTQAGISIPPGFVILANAFDRFLEETDLNIEIEARLKEVNPEDTNSIDKASSVLRDVFHDTKMPDDLAEEILKDFDKLGAEYVAVRSSATAEDSSIASWAGELDTFLNITRDNVVEKVKECWSSLFTPRAIFYRHEKDLVDAQVSVAVVIQKMIQSEISGIAFTVHPVTEDPNQMIIEAGLGLGEAIVSGQITPDSYIIGKKEMNILDINIGHQSKRLDRSVEGDNVWQDLGEEGESQKLTSKQVIELAQVCKNIEDHYGFPCDIEWAMVNGEIYVTQSRPITTLKNKV
jgi:pyruvate, water dikinase